MVGFEQVRFERAVQEACHGTAAGQQAVGCVDWDLEVSLMPVPLMPGALEPGAEVEVPVEQVTVGQVVLVRPGERVPVDGRVAAGRSAVDQSPITGESVPVDKSAGDEVFAGTINGEGSLQVRTTRAAGG